MPTFSVIIPTYNHADKIGRCLQSLIDQTFEDWEAIIVNNYSEDNTIEVVNSFKDKRIKLINFKNNGIIAASRNKGIKEAIADWICFLDSDDWWYSNKLQEVISYTNDYDLVFHDLNVVNEELKITRKIIGAKYRRPIFKDLLLMGNKIANSSVAVRRDIVLSVGLLSEDPRLVAAEDYDLWLRISEKTERFKYIPKLLAVYWAGGGNLSEVSPKQVKRQIAMYKKYRDKLSEKERSIAMRSCFYPIARLFQKMGRIDWARRFYRRSLLSSRWMDRLRSIYFLTVLIFK